MDARAKGQRLLAEGRLVVERAGSGPVVASCRGDSGAVYRLGFDPARNEWRCQCPTRSDQCSHLIALRLVTLREEAHGTSSLHPR